MIKYWVVSAVCVAALLVTGGCDAVNTMVFPNQVIGADGLPLTLEDIEAVVQDSTLSDDQMRAGLRDLGIEDEDLIEALLLL